MTPEEMQAEHTTSASDTFLEEVEALVRETRKEDLTPARLVELQTDIAAMSYFMATLLQESELRALDSDDNHSRMFARTVLSRMASNPKLSKNKADEEVLLDPVIEDLRQEYIRAKTEHTGMKERCRKIEGVLQALTMRISRFNHEQHNTSIAQQSTP